MGKLIVEDLSIQFGGVKALQGVRVEVDPGKFVGLMGPNGAGKTTLINCISRIYEPTHGKITFDGHDLRKLSGDALLELGISRTFQDLNFFNHMANMMVIDYVKLGQFQPRSNRLLRDGLQLRTSRSREYELKKNARKVLELFRQLRDQLEPPEKERQYPFLMGREGFPDLIDVEFQPISSLSFAWRRRLDLARALVSKPRILLLDEPAQGLPPSEIENLGKILKYVQSEFGLSALIVEHNVDTLMKISDSIVVMNYGEVIATGTPEEVARNPAALEVYLGRKAEGTPEAGQGLSVSGGRPASESEGRKGSLEPLLDVKDLDVYYGLAQALFSVSVKFYPEQIVSILGTNGSGKSTLMKAISGIEKPSFGEIRYKGEPLPLGWPEVAVEKGVQYVPQGHLVFPELTVRDNLRIGSYIFEKRGHKFEDGLEKALHYFPSLKSALDAQAASLSGGQQQMLAISQAIMGQPELLMLDEPSLGLSPTLVDKLFDIIVKISREERCAIILVEQNVTKALEISDYIVMLSTGVLIGEGAAEQLRKDDSVIKKYLGFR